MLSRRVVGITILTFVAGTPNPPAAEEAMPQYRASVLDRIGKTRMQHAMLIDYRKYIKAPSSPPPTANSIIREFHNEYTVSKTDKEKLSVSQFCVDSLSDLSFKDRDRKLIETLSNLNKNDLKSANDDLKQVDEIENLDRTLGSIVCRPGPAETAEPPDAEAHP